MEVDTIIEDVSRSSFLYSLLLDDIFGDTLNPDRRTFKVVRDHEAKVYGIELYDGVKFVNAINLHEEGLSSEVKLTSFKLVSFEKSLILLFEDSFREHFHIVKYDRDGNELLQTKVERSCMAYLSGSSRSNFNLRPFGCQNSQIIFTNHDHITDSTLTVLLDMNDLTIRTFNTEVSGAIVDYDSEEFVGIVSTNKDPNDGVTVTEVITMNGDHYDLTRSGVMKTCELLLHDFISQVIVQ